MGSWGVKLYQDDVAYDVKEEYIEALRKGISNEEITEKLIEEYTSHKDEEEESIFWLALSDIQWKYGRLLDKVKENAIKVIDSEIDLKRWEENSKLLEQRKRVLLELKEKLNTPQSSEKKVKSYGKPYKCEWQIGDVFAYPLKSEEAKKVGLDSQYLILIVVRMSNCYLESIMPVVKIKVTKKGKIPTTVEEINELEYIQSGLYTYMYKYIVDVTVDDLRQPKDENKLTPFYEFQILTSSKRVIPKELQYIGNFDNKIVFPKIEYNVSNKGSFTTTSLEKNVLWKSLEYSVIESYKNYNLKQAEIYQLDYWEKRGINREEKDKRIEEFLKKRGLL